jgi:hypothetical protein
MICGLSVLASGLWPVFESGESDSLCPLYEELAALVVLQAAVIREQAAVIGSLTARVIEQDELIARQDARTGDSVGRRVIRQGLCAGGGPVSSHG